MSSMLPSALLCARSDRRMHLWTSHRNSPTSQLHSRCPASYADQQFLLHTLHSHVWWVVVFRWMMKLPLDLMPSFIPFTDNNTSINVQGCLFNSFNPCDEKYKNEQALKWNCKYCNLVDGCNPANKVFENLKVIGSLLSLVVFCIPLIY